MMSGFRAWLGRSISLKYYFRILTLAQDCPRDADIVLRTMLYSPMFAAEVPEHLRGRGAEVGED